MNKLVTYTILVLGTLGFLLISGLVNSGMKEIVYEKNGLQFEYLNKSKAIKPSQEVQFFTSQDNNELTFYMNEGYKNQNFTTYLSVYKTIDPEENVHTLSVKAMNKDLSFQSTLEDLSHTELVNLISSINDFRGAKLSAYTSESGWFGYVDDTVVIFVLFGLIFFICCLIFNSMVKILSKRYGTRLEWIFPGTIVFILAFYAIGFNFSNWIPFSLSLNSVISFCSIFLPFLLFRFVIRKSSNLDFADREVLKFFTIIIGTYVIGAVLSRIGFAIDSSNFDNVMMIEKHGPFPIIMGMAISLASGNLLANLVRRMIYHRGSEKLLKKAEGELGRSNVELQSLQSTINPHFLYNSLNSIASTAKVDGDKTERMALALSSFYKYITNKKNEGLTILKNEVEMLNNYLEIEKIRFEDNLTVEIDVSSNAINCKLPRLLLQPLVENAVKYGYGESGINVKITAERISDQLIIRIYDSGAEFGLDMQIGFGIKSVNQKLELLYPDQHTLEFKNSPAKHILIEINQNEV
ncbi:MAG: hypothetical protein ACJA1A_000574 [Saprospiraceae bacterium]|jgi:hypothetical protein